jgi:hypothetical protein
MMDVTASQATREGFPIYPNATLIDDRTVSLVGGGGGVDSNYTTDDPLEIVVDFYEQKFGLGDKVALPGKSQWFFSEGRGDWESGRLLVVESLPHPVEQQNRTGKVTNIYIGRRDFPRAERSSPTSR